MPHEATIDRYCEAWSDPDPVRRAAALADVWAADATYTDPIVHAEGAKALLEHIAGVHAQMPGARIVRTSEVQVHHDVARFAWQVVLPDGKTLPEGLDLAIFDGSHRIKRIVGFFGPLAQLNS
jgi:ketosteroid isomerase-like protein